ncbi:MAG: hypothetical protein ACM3XM_10910 [Mycobacterium leprae]
MRASLLLVMLVLAGCSRPTNADPNEVTQLKAENEHLKGQVGALQSQLTSLQAKVKDLEAAQGGTVVTNLVNANYPKAILGQDGWQYAKIGTADLDGDGKDEKVVLLGNVQGSESKGGWMWDDGHAWSVYIEEADGTRTYVYTGWVQMGVLQGSIIEGLNGKADLLLWADGNGILLYRITYSGPQQVQARQIFSAQKLGNVTFTDPKFLHW